MTRKFRKRNKRTKQYLLYKKLLPVKPNEKVEIKLREIYQTFQLLDTDRICTVYKIDESKIIREITCVRYDLMIRNKWITIVRYDNCHGYLHRHLLTEIGKKYDIATPTNIKKNSTINYLLKWSTNDLAKNWLYYRRHFYKINKKKVQNLVDFL